MAKLKQPDRPDTAGRKRGTSLPIAGQGEGPDRAAPRSKRTPKPASIKPPVVSFVSLGCAKNLVDSEKMLGQLVESGAIISGDEAAADTIVVNTCGFLENSRTEALEILQELAGRKRAGKLRRIVVAGCLVQRDGEKIKEWVPEVDALVGVNNRDDVVRAVWRMDRDAATELFLGEYHPQHWDDRGRLRLTPRHYAYLRISESYNQKCTFCTIPSIRGPMHSKSPDELVAEGNELIADGVRELILIGQDTTSYGEDIAAHGGLAGLVRTLNEGCSEATWIRLMYVYPTAMTDAIIDALAQSERFVKYIDMPLQHINDRMLRAMGRRIDRSATEVLLDKLRRRIPGVTIRTTFIVGFPGETETEFAELERFVRDFGFDAAGAFMYSYEAETPSARIADPINDSLKRERHQRLMLAQQEVAYARAKSRIGQRFEVLVDGAAGSPMTGGENGADAIGADGNSRKGTVARHSGQAPDVDSVCLLSGGRHKPGQMVNVNVVEASGYDLIVRPVHAALTLK